MKKVLVFCFCLFGFTAVDAQDFGAYPSPTKWKQVSTDTARIIFTEGAEKQARRIAAIIHAQAKTNNAFGADLKKINIVLHQRTTQANGYVALAPFISEYYLVPGGNIFEFGNLPWTDQLALHEYRHVQQYNQFNKGVSKVFGFLFGQGGRALANSIAVPDWFYEGDAVYAETVFSPQGRGRMPYFLNGYHSLWKEGRNYSWMKLRNGSYADYVPNHYQLGYLLVNYGYEKYGTDFWKKVTTDAARFKGLIYPMQHAVKEHAQQSFKSFRKDALDFYSHEVSKRRDGQASRELVTNYRYPQLIGEDSLLYLKNSYRDLPAFYLKTKGKERKIALQHISSEDFFSYRKNLIAYTAYSTHSRWSLTDYSDIVLLDISTGREKRITSKGKYFTPDLSPDATKILAVSATDSLVSELQVLDLRGSLVQKISADDDEFFVHPRFINDQKILTGVRKADAKMRFVTIDLLTGERSALTPWTNATIGFPFVQNSKVYFTSSLPGHDALFEINLENKKVQQLLVPGLGNYFPSVKKDSLSWSVFTSNGYRLRQKALKDLANQPISDQDWTAPAPAMQVAHEKKSENLLAIPERQFAVSDYKKSTGLLNFHSWRPAYEDPEFSFSVYSDNILRTLSTEVFYRYNQNERSNAVGFNTVYGGLFPLLQAGFEYTKDRHVKRQDKEFTLDQSEARLGYSVPLNFTKGYSFKYANLGSNIVFNSLTPTGASKGLINGDQSLYLHHHFSWVQQKPRARQQIYSRLGKSVSLQYRHRLDDKGYQVLGGTQLYLPGLLKTHSLVLSGSLQETDTSNVLFSNRFSNARGYPDYFYSRMWKAAANYHLPLFYPDRGVANIVYLLRVRSNLFYDQSRLFSKDKLRSIDLRSVGSEVYFDTKWWNQLPVSIGLRYSYLLDKNLVGRTSPHVWELVLPVLLPD